jgi:hypothetical protein
MCHRAVFREPHAGVCPSKGLRASQARRISIALKVRMPVSSLVEVMGTDLQRLVEERVEARSLHILLALCGHAQVLRCPAEQMRARGRSSRFLHSCATNSCRNPPMLFGIWRVLKRLRLIGGKRRSFHDKTGKFNGGNSRGSEGHLVRKRPRLTTSPSWLSVR